MDSFLSRSKRGLRRRRYKKLGGAPTETFSGPATPPTGPDRDPGTVMQKGDAAEGLEELDRMIDIVVGGQSPNTVGHPSNDPTTWETKSLFVEAAETARIEKESTRPP